MPGFEIVLIVAVVCIVGFSAVKITRQYGRAVVFRFGRLAGMKGPGLFLIIPLVDQIVRVDLRVRQLDVPKQTIITRDNISVDDTRNATGYAQTIRFMGNLLGVVDRAEVLITYYQEI
jgi:regulator of protease activity HflC (stomatin/prohibitin superfamily)